MASHRKLQSEIDRCLKKVAEGVEVFQDIWEKVHNATNANQKEKYEADLKKEIKKLQRLRDQIKSWLTSPDVKDKSVLMENRRLIETQMERFKVVERETKTKAYSKEGLGAAQKLDPAQKERDEANQWLSNSIESLQIKTDTFESEIESLQSCTKKKKLDKEKQERVESLKSRLEVHKEHINRLEMVMRLLDNMSIDVDTVNKLRDSVDYFIESGSYDSNFQDSVFIYDEIPFDELNHNALEVGTAGSGADQDNDGGSGLTGNTGSTPGTSVSSTSPVPSLSAVGAGSLSNSHHSVNDEVATHTAVNESRGRTGEHEQRAARRPVSAATPSSSSSNSHGMNSSPLASVTPPPTIAQVVASHSPLHVPPSPAKAPAAPVVPPGGVTPSQSPVKPPLSAIVGGTAGSMAGGGSSNSSSSSSASATQASGGMGINNGGTPVGMMNHADGKRSSTSPTSTTTTPVISASMASVAASQRYSMMNGGSSVGGAAVSSVSSAFTAVPSSAQVVASSSAASASSPSISNSSVVRQLLPPTSVPASVAPAPSSMAEMLSSRLGGGHMTGRDDGSSNMSMGGSLFPGLKSPRAEPSVTSPPGRTKEVAPLLGLEKDGVLNSQDTQAEPLQHLHSVESEKPKDSSQMDILSMFGSMPGRPQSVPHSTGASPPAHSMAPTSADGRPPPGSTTMTMTTNTPMNHLPVGLHLGGGTDKASIAAFMAENKLNTLAGASGLVPNSTQNLHQHVLPSSVLGSVSGQQPPGMSATSSGTDLLGQGVSSSRLDGSVGASASSVGLSGVSGAASAASGVSLGSVGPASGMTETRISSNVAVNPTGPGTLTKDNSVQLQLLEYAAFRQPYQADGERSRLIPRTPYPGIPAYYPQVVPPSCDSVEFFSRLSTETLFFAFYYMEGTKAQYLAAKALKKQSWRFHTRYLMWFQRHEEPKAITDEYEQGAYIYFDFEKWSQRKKEGFTFEYRYLEDRDLN